MKRKVILLTISSVLLLTSCHLFTKENNQDNNKDDIIIESKEDTSTSKNEILPNLGTWWWGKNLDVSEYISFAKENNITEIYYCNYELNGNIHSLLDTAKKNNMNVYLLLGEKDWLEDRKGLDSLITNYINFQNENDNPFSGIHLDIEPHQFKDFKEKRETYLYSLIDLIKTNKDTYPSINFDYDIPFWLDDVIEYNNQSKETYKHIIDYANRTFLMSYRDTADKMYDVSKEEIEYAIENNKIVYLGAETYSEEGNQVSYLEEGKQYMYQELNKLRGMIPSNFGISIHHIEQWKKIKD